MVPSTIPRDRHHHVDVVRQQMPFFHTTLPMKRQLPQQVAQLSPQTPVNRLLAVLRDEHDVILTAPSRMIETSVVRHEDSLS